MPATTEEWGPNSPNGDMAPILERSIETEWLNGVDPLTVADRCDQECNAQALVRLHNSTRLLDFCGHHFNKNSDALSDQGWAVLESKSA